MEIRDVCFVDSVHRQGQLPSPDYPEIAFAGRSNVGKSSLINRLINRRSLVKVSSRPGKTQGLNFFLVNEAFYLVDLPGYGYAKVPKTMQDQWRGLIGGYLETRGPLLATVLIIDVRHEVKANDLELLQWLRSRGRLVIPVYTKIDKLSRGQYLRNAAVLDAAFGVTAQERYLFSAKTGEGRENLLRKLDQLLGRC
ncbi:MAG: ribosome biogenesis GTP-binding protein YihA/YsxC [Thermodesulfobacteriota bacterium]